MKRFYLILVTIILFAVGLVASLKTTAQSETNPDANSPLASANIVISQFQTAGIAGPNDEFIELHNTSSSSVDLNGFRVVYRSAAGTNDVAFVNWTSSTIVAPGGYYLIASTSYAGSVAPNITYNPTSCSCSMSATGGGLAIRSGALNTGVIINGLLNQKTGDLSGNGALLNSLSTVSPVAVSRAGNILTVGIVFNTSSGETPATSLSFTLNFSTADLTNPTNIMLGSGGNAADLSFNDTQAGAGRLGVLLDLPPQQTFGSLSQQLVLVDFLVTTTAQATTAISFNDSTAPRFISDINGNRLDNASTFTGATLSVNGPKSSSKRVRIIF